MTTAEIMQLAHERSQAFDDGIARLIDRYPDVIADDPIIAKMVKLSTGHRSYLDRHPPVRSNPDIDPAFGLQAS
jgi:hypothetical protein